MIKAFIGLFILLISSILISFQAFSDEQPTITDINFAPSLHDGLYISGDKISIIVSFSEPVKVDLTENTSYVDNDIHNCNKSHNQHTVEFRENLANLCNLYLTDSPFLILETGVRDQIARYTKGSGTKDLFFEFTVKPNDSSFEPYGKEYQHQKLGPIRGAVTVPWQQWIQGKDVAITSNGNIIKSIDGRNADLTFNDPWQNPLRTSNRILLDGKSPIHWKYHTITGDWAKDKTLVTGGAEQVFLIDLDQDGNIDILSVGTGKFCQTPTACGLVWHKNMGDKSFISTYIYVNPSLRTVQASDMDNDGDIDIIAGGENGIIWFENINNQDFAFHEILNKPDLEVSQVFISDIDADGDQDVLAAIQWTNTFAWYESVNNADYFIEHLISDNALGAHDIFAIDIDLDQDVDLATASWGDNTVAWYENDNSQGFTKHQITTSALSTSSVYAIDLDQDGDIDVLADSAENDSITWYENDATGSFISHDITITADRAYDVFPIDIDSDGDIDLLSASSYDHKIAWYENDGKQNFVSHIITTQAVHASSVSAADIDNDGDIDVVSSSQGDSSVNWFENTTISFD